MPESATKMGWPRVAFGDVVRLSKERALDPDADGFARYVGLEHLEPGDLKIRSWGDVADGTTFTSVFRPGQVLFGKRRAYQHKVAVADFSGVCSGDIYVFEPKNDHLLSELLPFICQAERFFEHAVRTSAGSLSPRTNWKSLVNYEFALPPLEEQRRIVAVLTEAETYKEALVESALRAAAVEESLFWSFITKGGTSATRAASGSHIGSIPTVWPLVPISDVAEVAYGISAAVSSNTDPAIGWPILTGANISLSGEIDLHKLVYHAHPSKDAFILRRGDVLLNWRSGSPAHVGKAALFELDGSWTYASFLLRARSRPNLNNRYLWRLLNFMRKHQIFSRSTSHQVNFKMNAAYFREVQVPCPPRRIQDEVVDLLLPLWDIEKQLESRDSRVRSLTAIVLNETNETSS